MSTGPVEDRFVSATDIASLAYCEQRIVLASRHGNLTTPEQRQAQARGVEHHERHDAVVRQYHNESPAPRQSPCFIASHVYGLTDERTNELRRFRDEVLLQSAGGRALVSLYYHRSPSVVRWLERRPNATAVVRTIVDLVRIAARHIPRRAADRPCTTAKPH